MAVPHDRVRPLAAPQEEPRTVRRWEVPEPLAVHKTQPAMERPKQIAKRPHGFLGLGDHPQDQEFEDDIHGLYYDGVKAAIIQETMQRLTYRGVSGVLNTTADIEDVGRSFHEDSVPGQLAPRMTIDAALEMEAFNKQLRQATGANMMRRTQRS